MHNNGTRPVCIYSKRKVCCTHDCIEPPNGIRLFLFSKESSPDLWKDAHKVMSPCLSLDWNVISMVRGIQERFALESDYVAKTEHRTPRHSNGCCGLSFFLHGLPTDNLHLGISLQLWRELGPGTQSRT